MPSLTGRTLKKEWRVGKLLGAGACAEVYEVERVAVTARSGSCLLYTSPSPRD